MRRATWCRLLSVAALAFFCAGCGGDTEKQAEAPGTTAEPPTQAGETTDAATTSETTSGAPTEAPPPSDQTVASTDAAPLAPPGNPEPATPAERRDAKADLPEIRSTVAQSRTPAAVRRTAKSKPACLTKVTYPSSFPPSLCVEGAAYHNATVEDPVGGIDFVGLHFGASCAPPTGKGKDGDKWFCSWAWQKNETSAWKIVGKLGYYKKNPKKACFWRVDNDGSLQNYFCTAA